MTSLRAIVACAASLVVVPAAVLGAGAVTVVDDSSPLRCYYRFAADLVDPGPLRARGEQLLGKRAYDRLARATRRAATVSRNDGFAVFRPSGVVLREARKVGTIAALGREKALAAAGAVDWHELVFRRMFFDPYTAPPPPADWATPTFDDSGWVAAARPFQADMPTDLPPAATTGNMRTVHVNVLQYIGTGMHAACYRARFEVDDPARTGGLTLAATYRGGLRVLVNGTEVARGHLPKGDLSADTPGQAYPLEAYADPALRDRTLGAVAIPARLLRSGANVLAMEVRASLLHPIVLKRDLSRSWNALHDREGLWRHGYLGAFKLTSPDGSVRSAKGRPPGLCAWAEDMHRRVRSDDVPPAGSPGVLRMVGPRNGSCSAQLVLSTDRDVAAIETDVTELRSAGGATIPASALRVFHMIPYPLEGFSEKLGDERGLAGSFPTQARLRQYAKMPDARQTYIFDQITPRPQPLPAGRSRPLWISLQIPPDASGGVYRGTLRCRADGRAEVQVPVEAEVVGWRLPDTKDFQTFVGLEENPYGVARQYGVAPWSNAHWKLLDASFRQMGRCGAKWLNVPVIRGTEFGNRDEAMIRWVRKRDGSLSYDFTILDRYLDLAVRHLGKPRMINFVVMLGLGAADARAVGEIMVTDEATGRTTPMPASGEAVPPARKRQIWLPFATALHRHLQAKGLDKAMHWGYPLDKELDHELVVLLGKNLPAVKWNGGPHQIGNWGYKEPKYYDVFGTVRYFDNWPGFRMSGGWQAPQVHLSIPRIDSSVQSLITASGPFAFRTLVNHSLALGRAGFCRVGADEWASSHYAGMKIPTWIVGMPVLFTLWPGPDGAESSARHEALIEGVQEGEARITIEKALAAGRLPPGLRRRLADVLRRHYLETTFFQNKLCIHELEAYHWRWRGRSRELYRAAADVAGAGEAEGGR